MNRREILGLNLAIFMVVFGCMAMAPAARAAEIVGTGGEILATHHCPRHGYTLRVIRPTGSGSSNARQIQVDNSGIFFHATQEEVDNLANLPPNDFHKAEIPNPGEDGQRYCVRTGHLIPPHETVYQVTLVHHEDYNGNTSVFFDSNAEAATLTYLIGQYAQKREGQGDNLPATCQPMECLSGSSGVSSGGSGGSGIAPGTYTSADGQVHDLSDLNPPSQDDGDGTPVRPSVQRAERIRAVPGTVTGPGRTEETEAEADVVDEDIVEFGNVTEHKCPWQEGTRLDHRCAEQCSGPNRSWNSETWICTVTSGVNPFNSFGPANTDKRR